MNNTVEVFVHLRRFDITDNPEVMSKRIVLDRSLDYASLKREVIKTCGIDDIDGKVIKLRNSEFALLPLSALLEGNNRESPFVIDVANIQIPSKNNASLLQDAYLDAIRQKLRSMESRVNQAEHLIPQLQCRRQAHMEQTINSMSTRVAFLNRRIDELMPPAWKTKITQKA